MPVLPRVTLSVGLLGSAILAADSARPEWTVAVRGQRGRGGGRLGQEVAAVQGRCHDDWSPRSHRSGGRDMEPFRVKMMTRQGLPDKGQAHRRGRPLEALAERPLVILTASTAMLP